MHHATSLPTLLAQAGLTATPDQLTQLDHYKQLALSWNDKLNLIAPSTIAQFDTRHLLDSAQLVPDLLRLAPQAGAQVLDVGSGAGLPGLVLAILCPQHKFTLAEKIQKKASFLVTAAHKLGLANVKVEADDVQNLPAGFADVVTARAVAELADLLALTAPHLKTDGAWLLLKGEAVEREINALKSPFRSPDDLTIEKHPSIVSPSGCVLVIRRT